jgi:hypothetical protein
MSNGENGVVILERVNGLASITIIDRTSLLLEASNKLEGSEEYVLIESSNDKHQIEFYVDYSIPIVVTGEIIKSDKGYKWVRKSLSDSAWSYLIPNKAELSSCK